MIEDMLPEVFKFGKNATTDSESSRYQLLSLQGFVLKFYLEVCEKLTRKQVHY